MSKPLFKDNFFSENKRLEKRVEILERMVRILSSLTEINTTGLSNEQIDSAVTQSQGYAPPNGKLISDPTNEILLIRQNAKWKKIE